MKKFLKSLSLLPRGLRYKLMVAFCLMSVVPLLICVYLAANYIFPIVDTLWDISIVLLITVFITFLGMHLARTMVDPIIKMATEARIIANGDLERIVEIRREDEIGELGKSLNMITSRIKANMDELRSYGEKTKDINVEIHKKVLVLTDLLQIGNLISEGLELDKILNFSVEKITQMPDVTCAFIMTAPEAGEELEIRSAQGIASEEVLLKRVRFGQGILGRVAATAQPTVIDSSVKPTTEIEAFRNGFKVKNCAIIPIRVRGKARGLLCLGNNLTHYTYLQDDLELFNVFVRQISIAIENDLLLRKTEELTIIDDLTGLYNEFYIRSRLDEEIKRAVSHQRPCSLIMLDIDNFKKYREQQGEPLAKESLKKLAQIIKEFTTDVDKVARFEDDAFAIVLPEKNKRGAIKMAEQLREKIETTSFQKEEVLGPKGLTVCGGVSENPIDGIKADDLIQKALEAIKKAKSEGKNKVEA